MTFLGFGLGQDVLGQACLEARQIEFGSGVVKCEVLPRRPFEERPDRRQSRVLAANAQGITIAFPVV